MSAAPVQDVDGARRSRPSRVLSVISRRSSSAGTPCAAAGPRTVSGKRGSSRQRVDRLTATGIRGPSSSHAAAWASAWSRTRSVSRWIRPVSSATGMKSTGRQTMPRVGCRQRTSASTPTRSPVGDRSWAGSAGRARRCVQRAAQVAEQGEPRRSACAWSVVEPRDARAGCSLAVYIATSACRSSGVRVVARPAGRDADAGLDVQGDAVDDERAVEHLADARGGASRRPSDRCR